VGIAVPAFSVQRSAGVRRSTGAERIGVRRSAFGCAGRSQDIGNTLGLGSGQRPGIKGLGKANRISLRRRTLNAERRTVLLDQAFAEAVIQKGDGHQDYPEDQARQNSIRRRNFGGIEDQHF
jgi:hypothetical protein